MLDTVVGAFPKSRTVRHLNEFDPSIGPGVIDSCCLIRADKFIDRFIDDNQDSPHPLLIIPQSVVDEGLTYKGKTGDITSSIDQLIDSQLAQIVDIQRLSTSDSRLHYELDIILPALSQLTPKAIINGIVANYNNDLFKKIADITLSIPLPRRNREFHIKTYCKPIVDHLMFLFDDYMKLSRPSKAKSLNRSKLGKKYAQILPEYFEIIQRFKGEFKKQFSQCVSGFNHFHEALNLPYHHLKKSPKNQVPYLTELQELHAVMIKSIFRRLLYQGLSSKMRHTGQGHDLPPVVKRDIKNQYEKRYRSMGITDFEIAGSYALPLEELGYDNFGSHQPTLTIISNDMEVSLVHNLRRQYLQVKKKKLKSAA